jgi:hypothetical protein
MFNPDIGGFMIVLPYPIDSATFTIGIILIGDVVADRVGKRSGIDVVFRILSDVYNLSFGIILLLQFLV